VVVVVLPVLLDVIGDMNRHACDVPHSLYVGGGGPVGPQNGNVRTATSAVPSQHRLLQCVAVLFMY